MSKLWKVFVYEYSRHVLRRRFIFAALSIPLFVGVIMGISIFSAASQMDARPVGYVDHSGLLANPVYPPQKPPSLFEKPVEIRAYPSEAEARAALDAGTIQAFYVLAPDYRETSKAQLVFQKSPGEQAQSKFSAFLQANLLASQPPDIAKRLVEGSNVVIQSPDGSRKMAGQDVLTILMPMFAAVIFLIVVMTSGGYLLQAVVEEKENRTIEMIVTSVSPGQLMGGKILGDIAVGLTQLLIWMGFAVIALLVGRSSVDWMQQVQLDPNYLVLMALALLPSFIMVAAIMATIGSTVTEMREAQQIIGLFTLPISAPFWLIVPIMSNPGGPLAIGLSFFPLTAPITLLLRAGFTQIPTLQLAANLAVLYVFAAVGIWVAARAFRLGMLSYGKRLSLKQVLSRRAAGRAG